MTETKHIQEQKIPPKLIPILEQIYDPEIPVLSIMDMGIVREAKIKGDVVYIKITPTYSGCPAMDVIGDDIRDALVEAGYKVQIEMVLAPAWTTDWITKKGRAALEKYGVAPPLDPIADKDALLGNKKIVKCTLCGSTNTQMISQFGSTACKAMFRCDDCEETFDYFKCLK